MFGHHESAELILTKLLNSRGQHDSIRSYWNCHWHGSTASRERVFPAKKRIIAGNQSDEGRVMFDNSNNRSS